jgi:two-component system, OmpR family, phosphate regulon sensor histidine kinase PhoR
MIGQDRENAAPGLAPPRVLASRVAGPEVAAAATPAAAPAAQVGHTAAAPAMPQPAPESEAAPAPARILVVDDEYGVRSAVAQILEMEGYEVDSAGTGEEALALLAASDCDIALLDYRLPDTDGLALHKRIVAGGKNIMTCMITAYADIDLACAATFQGIDFFLPKPFMPDDLLSVVETLVKRKQARAEEERLRREHEASLLALAEEKTQTHSLISSLRDAVLVINQTGDVVLANQAMTALLDVGEQDVLRRPAAELLEGGPLAALVEPLAAPAKDRTIGQLSIGERNYMTSIVTFRTEDGGALGRILTLSDISQVRRLAMEKERFIRTMVHELKSPLGAVRSIIEVTTDKSMGDDLQAYLPLLRRAENRIDDLVQLISDLLLLSKSEQAQAASDPRLLDVAPAVEAALAAQAEQLTARSITASAQIDADLPPVLAAAEDLEMILTNLVGNAAKYNRDGGSVTVRAQHEGEWLRIDVEDTGIGIAPENVDQVFTEFFREKRRETKNLEGSGLGLAIVKRLTERAGGRLQLVSELGRGSTFSVLLPG